MDAVGARLKLARDVLGWTQEDLAKAAAVNFSTYRSWEASGVTPPTGKLTRVANVTGVDANFLLGTSTEVWGPAIQAARRELYAHLRTAAGASVGATLAARAAYVLRWFGQRCPVCSEKLLAGVLRLDLPTLRRCMTDAGDPIIASALEQLSQFAGVPPVWFATGLTTDLVPSTEALERWLPVIARLEAAGVTPDVLEQQAGIISALVRR